MSEKPKLPVAFVCHASADKERFVLPFARALRENEGVDAWVDKWEMKPGDRLSKVFDELAKAKAVIPVLSGASVDAPWLRAEIDSVVDNIVRGSKKIIPVLLDGLPKERIPAPLGGRLYVRGDNWAQAATEVARGIFDEYDHPEKPQVGVISPDIARMAGVVSPTLNLRALLRMAEAGDPNAQFALGVMCYKGEGVPVNYLKAAKWIRLAAEQGIPDAQGSLAQLHREGKGVPWDDVEAAKWIRLVAEQGIARAQYNLGFLHGKGEGVKQSDTEAAKWYRCAAEQGFTPAQWSLGVLYGRGIGVPQSHYNAYVWLFLAVLGGESAERSMRVAASHLSREELMEAGEEVSRRSGEIRRNHAKSG